MKLLQLHYTSCRRGMGGGAGFQTRSHTEGLPTTTRRLIERNCAYQPARDLPDRPTAEQIRDFPVTFRYRLLEGSSWTLVRAGYTGQDYSGRWGNYFAHALTGDQALVSSWPIDLVEWDGWVETLPTTADTEEAPVALEAVDLSSIPPAQSFSFAELALFLQEADGRMDRLEAMIQAIFLRSTTSRPIVVRDAHLNGAFWVACVTKAFSKAHASAIEFSTFQFDARSAATVTATTTGTDFVLTDNERRFQFYAFDFDTDRHSDVEEGGRVDGPARRYAHTVARWMAEAPATLHRFHEFMETCFSHQALTPELVRAVDLFEVYDARKALTGNDLVAAIDFASQYATPRGRTMLIGCLYSSAMTLVQNGAEEHLERITRFLAVTSETTGIAEHRRAVWELWFRMLAQGIARSRIDPALAFRRELLRMLGPYRAELDQMLLEPEHQEMMEKRLGQLPVVARGLLITLVCEAARTIRKTPAHAAPEVRALLDRAGDEQSLTELTSQLLQNLPPGEQGTHDLRDWALVLAGSEATPKVLIARKRAVGRSLATFLPRLTPELASAIREELAEDPAFLEGEWQALFAAGTELPADQWARYERNVLRRLPDFAANHRSRLATMLLKSLAPAEAARLATRWIQDGIADFSPELRTSIVYMANDALPLSTDAEGDSGARAILEAARRYRVALEGRPDRATLRCFLAEVRQRVDAPDGERIRRDLVTLKADLYRLNDADLAIVRQATLDPALRGTVKVETHGHIIALLRPPHMAPAAFLQAYAKVLATPHAESQGLLVTSATFWYGIGGSDAALEPLRDGARRCLLEVLLGLDDPAYEQVTKKVRMRLHHEQARGAPSENGPEGLQARRSDRLDGWKEAEAMLSERRQGHVRSAVRWMKRITGRSDA